MNRILYMASVTGILFSCSHASFGQGGFEALSSKIPATANAIISIDAEGLRNSALGKKENWADKNEAAYVNSPLYLPPEASHIIVGSQVNTNQNLETDWEIAVMHLTDPISSRAIARAEGGIIDKIGETSVVWSPSDAYFVQLASDTLGIMAPAHRQIVSRWVSSNGAVALGLQGFLAESLYDLNDSTQIIMAINLKDAVIPHLLKDGLSKADFLKDDDRETWQTVIESLQGAKLAVSVSDKIEGRLEIQFGSDPSQLGNKAKDGILLTLQKYGVAFENLNKWRMSQSQNNLILEGELEKSDTRKIMSLLQLPSSNFSVLSDAEPAKENEQDKVVKASQNYFKSVSTLLDDLQSEFKTNRDARKNFAATYMQRYAKRIDDLPILNVDVELVNYGLSIAETLRSTSVTQGESNIDTGIRKAQAGANNYGNGYYNNYRSGSSVKTMIAREEQGGSSKVRFQNWKEIQDATANIRVKMTQKYNAEF